MPRRPAPSRPQSQDEGNLARLPPAEAAAAEGARPLPGAGLQTLPLLLGLLPARLAQRQPQLRRDPPGPRATRAFALRGARRDGPRAAAAAAGVPGRKGRRRGAVVVAPPADGGDRPRPKHAALAEAQEGQHGSDRAQHAAGQPARGRGQGLLPER